MDRTPIYYTDDITCMPVSVIWRYIPGKASVSGILSFLYILSRKLLRQRFPANHASIRPVVLPKIPQQSVPNDVQSKMMPYVDACRGAGFTLVTWLRPNSIGHKTSYGALLLHESGQVGALVTWLRLCLGPEVRQWVVFSCQSFTSAGVQLSTGPVAETDRHLPLIPPSNEPVFLPVDTSPHDTIKAHFDRIAGRHDLLSFDAESVERQALKSAQDIYDHLIGKRYYVPITSAEVEHLSAVSDVIEAELA